MFDDALFIARKDLAFLLRQRETILWTFLMPPLFFYFIGTVTGGFATPGGADSSPAALLVDVPSDSGFLVEEIERRLADQNFATTRGGSSSEDEDATDPPDRRLILPTTSPSGRDFTEAVLAGEQQTVTFRHLGEGPMVQYDELRVARAVYGVVADLAVFAERGIEPSPGAFQRIRDTPRALTLEVRPAGERQQVPSGYEQAIPGIMVMFTMLVLLTSGAMLLVLEREEGLLRRLASTPISPGSVVFGKWLARMAVGVVQVGFGFVVGTLMFGMPWGGAVPMIFAVLFGWAAFNASLALFLGNLARTQSQMAGIGLLVTMILAALGGCWWPIEITPQWMQGLSLLLPSGWAMDAMHRLISFGQGPVAAIPHVTAMLAAALVFGWLGARAFRYT